MVQIQKNNYQRPTEVREYVVQAICDSFLSHNIYRIFHPFNERYPRMATKFCERTIPGMGYVTDGKFHGFHAGWTLRKSECNEHVEFHGCEMKRAFKELIDAGYFIFRVWEYGTWMGYIVESKPIPRTFTRYERVFDFTDEID